MAVASFDAQFSFQQDAVARLGERGISSKLSDEQQKKFQESPAMIAARKVDELAQQYTNDRDNQRMITDTFFRAEESDWSASKAFEYKRAVNYYDILGIEEYATLEEVKAAYKKLSLIYHPDKTKGLPPEQQKEYAAVFISVKNANLVLGDKPTRRQYDYDRDHDRAKAEVQGTEVHQEQHIDLSEVLDRIKEMQRPPGQNIDVPLQCKLEKFFYGGRKEIQRKRTVRDFYQGVLTEEHTLRVLIQKGASEPLATVFKEQGDWHAETKPDNITVRLTSKPHPHVDRHGGDLLVRQELLLGEEAVQDPRLTAHAPGLRGRHVLVWGRNPLRGSVPGAVLQLALRGEGLTKTGALRLRCRCGAGGAGVEPSFTRDSARAFLRDAVAAREACRQAGAASAEELRARLEALLAKRGCEPSPRRLWQWLSAALRQVEGEWGLIAAVNAMLSHGEGAYPGLGRFLERHRLAPEGGLASGAEEAEEIWAAGGAQHGKGGLCSAPAMRRRGQQALDSTCEAELTPLGQPVSLFTSPTCVVSFYSNAGALRGPAEQLPPHSLFALCLSSSACSRARASAQWDALKEQLVPLLMGTAFLLLPAARQTLPLPLADFAVAEGASRDAAPPAAPPMPWKRLGDEAFRRGDWYEALVCYACCLEALPGGSDDVAARVLSNRAACLAKVGEFEESVAEAKRALERKPTWGRAWSRVGSALAQLGEERKTEAVDALFKAAEFEPSIATADALADAAAATSTPSWEAAEKEKELGNTALRGRKWGAAAAHYTLGLALVPPQEEEPLAFLRAVLRSNRAAAFCRLRSWNAAVVDGRAAVAAQPGWAKMHNRLGAALLGAGQVEQAYTEFAWALLIDNQNDVARQGQEACLSLLPLWHSQPARARLEARFGADLGRPRENTRVFAISDLHFDHKPNEEWVHRLDELEFQEDVLIVAGNIANTHFTAAKALRTLKSKFRRVFYTPGNQDVWMNPGEVHNSRFPDSFSKFLALLETCDDLGVDVFPAAVCSDVFIVPLLSWYNAQFDKKSRPDPNYNADETCVWPLDAREQLWKYMLKLNEAHLERAYRGTVISFSHFLPLATLPFSSDGNIRAAQSMGCEDIEDHIRMARSSVHVYGHSTMGTAEQHGGVMFVNHYHGYLEEGQPAPHSGPLLLFDGSRGLAVSDSRKQQQQQDGSLL